MSGLTYVRGNHGGVAHIAAHVPTGYGVRSLCGTSWNEGWYSCVSGEPEKVCSKCAKRPAAPDTAGGNPK